MNASKGEKHAVSERTDLILTGRERELAEKIRELYALFGVRIGALIGAASGSRVTRLVFRVEPDTRVSRITGLRDDISLALSVPKVRLICPLPGELAFAVEVPNGGEGAVSFDAIYDSAAFSRSDDPLRVVLGRDLTNEPVCLELSKAPHVLLGGQACSGKTALLKSMVVSLLRSTGPDQVKLLLITPQKGEMEIFEDDPHLWKPIVDDPQIALDSLQWLGEECDRRHALFRSCGVRNIDACNAAAEQPLARIVVMVDEISFLSRHHLRDFEDAVCRIAQRGRAAGIHLVLATGELVSKNVTGIIKANIPTRIALATKSAAESRTVIDTNEAECLLLKGDMLLCDRMMHPAVRVQAAYLSDEEIQSKQYTRREAE